MLRGESRLAGGRSMNTKSVQMSTKMRWDIAMRTVAESSALSIFASASSCFLTIMAVIWEAGN